ncbi:MAG TPA: chemotaxis-specific protein-glutamate methyltransferase CheB [Polyangiaceae bacterium]|jgi:two-component system chemotaxis response regulator CheB
MTIRVVVVDDSSFVRRAISRMLSEEDDISVVGVAAHGNDALELVRSRAPDVVTLDLEMPIAGGLDTLRKIMAERPTPVVLVSAHTHSDAARTLEGLAAGAVDFVDKSAVSLMDVHALRDELVHKVRLAAQSRPRPFALAPSSRAGGEALGQREVGAVVLGASTGGPAAIQTLIARLPSDSPLPLLIVQHMPGGFTRAFAERLNSVCALPVKEAADGDRFERGVFVAPGGFQVEVRRAGAALRLALRPGGASDLHVPSIDVAAVSAASARGPAACLVVLTGMGSDGLAGARAVREAGGVVVAQDEASSVIYGMPRVIAQAGLADGVLSLERIGDWMARLANRAMPP